MLCVYRVRYNEQADGIIVNHLSFCLNVECLENRMPSNSTFYSTVIAIVFYSFRLPLALYLLCVSVYIRFYLCNWACKLSANTNISPILLTPMALSSLSLRTVIKLYLFPLSRFLLLSLSFIRWFLPRRSKLYQCLHIFFITWQGLLLVIRNVL